MGNFGILQKSLDHHIVAAAEAQIFFRADEKSLAALLLVGFKMLLGSRSILGRRAVVDHTRFKSDICLCAQQSIQRILQKLAAVKVKQNNTNFTLAHYFNPQPFFRIWLRHFRLPNTPETTQGITI